MMIARATRRRLQSNTMGPRESITNARLQMRPVQPYTNKDCGRPIVVVGVCVERGSACVYV